MLASVELHRQPAIRAVEVDDVVPDRMLAAELQPSLLRAHDDKTYSLCDAMSFVVMERLSITDAIAFDRHFAEYGRFALL